MALAGMGPVPFASMLLADMGAEVVRVVAPGGKSASKTVYETGRQPPSLDLVNRGVASVEVDLKSREGLDFVLELAAHADVFIEGYRPGVAERLGVGPEPLSEANPGIVYGRLTGYGQTGPLASAAGHDINYVAQSGALRAMARAGEAPRPPLNLLGDYAGGAAIAAFGIVCALFEARVSGQGQVVDAAMVDGVALLTTKLQGLRAAGLFSDDPGTNSIDSGAPFYDTYRCEDGEYIAVGALEPAFYEEFVTRLGVDLSGWPEQGDRPQWPRLRQLIGAAVASKPQAHWIRAYAGTDACVSGVLSFDQSVQHPHNVARALYETVDGALHPSPAPRLSRTPARGPRAPEAKPRAMADVLACWAGGSGE